MKRKLSSILLASLMILGITGCGAQNEVATQGEEGKTIIKIGINGTDFRLWDQLNERLASEGIVLEPVSFSDYIKPNIALAEGEIDLNAFQHELYFNKFISEHDLDLAAIGYTFIAPLGLYSEKITDLAALETGSKVAIPNDATNGGRALLLLESAGLITLDGKDRVTPTPKNIVSNPKALEFISMESVQIPRALADVDLAAINGGAATDAGIYDYIFREDPNQKNAEQYFNIIAARADQQENEAFKKLLEAYYTDETKQAIEEIYGGAYIPVW